MAKRSKQVREIRLVAQTHREAEERLRRAYRQLWQASWEQKQKPERCEDGQDLVCPGIDHATRASCDD